MGFVSNLINSEPEPPGALAVMGDGKPEKCLDLAAVAKLDLWGQGELSLKYEFTLISSTTFIWQILWIDQRGGSGKYNKDTAKGEMILKKQQTDSEESVIIRRVGIESYRWCDNL